MSKNICLRPSKDHQDHLHSTENHKNSRNSQYGQNLVADFVVLYYQHYYLQYSIYL